MFNNDIAIRQENIFKEYQIALTTNAASAAQQLSVKTDSSGNGTSHQIVILEARGDNITFCFGGSTISASNTISGNALTAPNFSVPNGAIITLSINGNAQNFVSVQADTGSATTKAIIRLATFN